jgi:hypothetical protein
MASMTMRKGEGKLNREASSGMVDPFKMAVKESGGGGAFSTGNDYIKFLIAILQNNGKLFRT